ncbi:uncharacterized protein [Nerophis lumbriciformis]|uniref:uncharacterized protein n=1 Tax=Nerophis lumbriciformis TaxID=546530 RepID=UPI002ADF76B8|nr:uncharacterized protein LOC133606515 [Nerophis lumbriciformis]
MATLSARKREFFIWSDDEVELLLKVTQEYKTFMAAKNVDWESSQSKYGDILARFLERYPSPMEASLSAKDFPHQTEDITKAHLTTKLKNIRVRYRQAVDSGRKSGHGRVVLIYFDECESIWGGCPATVATGEGLDTSDLERAPHAPELSSGEPSPPSSLAEEPASQSRKRRLDEELGDYRTQTLRKALTPASIAQEDLELKRHFYRRQEETDRKFMHSMDRITSSIEMLVKHITQPSTQ